MTQLQVGENINSVTSGFEGWHGCWVLLDQTAEHTGDLLWFISQPTRDVEQCCIKDGPMATMLYQHLKTLGNISCWFNIFSRLRLLVICGILSKNTTEYLHFSFNPLTAKLFNLNFHPLEVVSHWRDPQIQVSENYSDLTKWRSTLFKYCWLMSHFIFNMFKRWYLMC